MTYWCFACYTQHDYSSSFPEDFKCSNCRSEFIQDGTAPAHLGVRHLTNDPRDGISDHPFGTYNPFGTPGTTIQASRQAFLNGVRRSNQGTTGGLFVDENGYIHNQSRPYDDDRASNQANWNQTRLNAAYTSALSGSTTYLWHEGCKLATIREKWLPKVEFINEKEEPIDCTICLTDLQLGDKAYFCKHHPMCTSCAKRACNLRAPMLQECTVCKAPQW